MNNNNIDNDHNLKPKLFIRTNSVLQPLGQWSIFFLNFGEYLNKLVFSPGRRGIIALAMPTRLFALSLTAFGHISNRIINSYEADCEQYIKYLKSLEPNTPVRIRLECGKAKKGFLIGYKKRGEILYFDVQEVKSGIRYIKASEARKIDVIEKEVKLTKTQMGRDLTQASPFALDILGEEYASRLMTESALDLVFIGPRERIRREVTEQHFFSKHNNQGTLQEIIRTAEFQSSVDSHRSKVLSGRNNTKDIHSNIPDPPFVFFDGAQGFLKWRSYWKKSSWVIFLDRTEPQFFPAIEQINQDFFKRKQSIDLSLLQQVIPQGIEVVGFEV